jgi:3-hydroxyacyl-[acyl-carrier-protein] dehydratase
MSTNTIPDRATPLPAIDDAVTTPGVGVTARKTVRATDPYLAGHYPGFTIYPGVFVIESVHQAISRYVADTRPGTWSVSMAGIDSVRFTKPLRPGDTLHLTAICAEDGDRISAKVRCVDDDGTLVTKMTARFDLTEQARRG